MEEDAFWFLRLLGSTFACSTLTLFGFFLLLVSTFAHLFFLLLVSTFVRSTLTLQMLTKLFQELLLGTIAPSTLTLL